MYTKADLILVDNDAFPSVRWKAHKLNRAEAALVSDEGFDSASVLKVLRSKLAARNATVVVAQDMSKEELLAVMEKV